MDIYLPEKISGQQRVFLTQSDLSVSPKWADEGGCHILNVNQTASPAGCTLLQEPFNYSIFFFMFSYQFM